MQVEIAQLRVHQQLVKYNTTVFAFFLTVSTLLIISAVFSIQRLLVATMKP